VRWTRSFILIAFAVFSLAVNQGVVNSVSTNFFVENLGVTGAQMGIFTAAREFVGFMMFAVAAITVRFSATKIAGVALMIGAFGYVAYGQVSTFTQLLIVAMIGSLGFHTWMQVYGVLSLSLADEGHEGRLLGKLSSIGSIGTFTSMLVTLFIVGIVGMRQMFSLSGVLLVVAAAGLFLVPKNPRLVRPRGFVFKRRYGLYYLLNFLDGCRAEISMSFALLTLVSLYKVPVQSITLLQMISAVLAWFTAPRIGALVDRIGEKPVLTVAYSANTVVFLSFAFVSNAAFLGVMYIVYTVAGTAMMARNTYLKKIADPVDLSPSMAMGVTMMHVAAVAVPFIASLMWQAFGYQIVFLFGTVFIVASIVVTQWIRVPQLVVRPLPAAAAEE
jgi:MFS family permease